MLRTPDEIADAALEFEGGQDWLRHPRGGHVGCGHMPYYTRDWFRAWVEEIRREQREYYESYGPDGARLQVQAETAFQRLLTTAERERDEYKTRAELAEQRLDRACDGCIEERDEARRARDEYKARAESWSRAFNQAVDAKAAIVRELDEWKARAEKAEAAAYTDRTLDIAAEARKHEREAVLGRLVKLKDLQRDFGGPGSASYLVMVSAIEDIRAGRHLEPAEDPLVERVAWAIDAAGSPLVVQPRAHLLTMARAAVAEMRKSEGR